MNRFLCMLVLSAFFAAPLVGLERHQSRHLDEIELWAPLGTHTIGDLFASLNELNKDDGLVAFPKVKDDRVVTLRPGDKKRSFIISATDFLNHLNRQVKLFERDYQVKVSRRSFQLIKYTRGGEDLGARETSEQWMKELPRISKAVVVTKGQESQLKTGSYEEEVLIQGKAYLTDGDAVFRDLKVEGSLEVKGRKIHGESLTSVGRIELNEASRVEFKEVETGGDILLEEGTHLKTKVFRFKENGRLHLGKDSHLILN